MVTPERRTLPAADVVAREAERATAYVQGLRYSRCPLSMCPVIGQFLRTMRGFATNESEFRSFDRRAVRSLGTAGDRVLEVQREWMAHDWYCRLCPAAWLGAAGLGEEAARLKALGPTRDSRLYVWDLLENMSPRGAAYATVEPGIVDLVEAIQKAWPGRLGALEMRKAVEAGIAGASEEAWLGSGTQAAWEAAYDAEPLRQARAVITEAAWVMAAAWLTPAPRVGVVVRAVVSRPPDGDEAWWTVADVVEDYASAALWAPLSGRQRSSLRLVDRMIAAGAG